MLGQSKVVSRAGQGLAGPAPKNQVWGVDARRWGDWKWQQAHRIRTRSQLEQFIDLTKDERRACEEATDRFRLAITPYYLSLIDPEDPHDPIRKQCIPRMAELKTAPGEREDPLGEESSMPVPGVTHRYPDRVLFYTTHNCPVYCRYCLRKRKVSDPSSASSKEQLQAGVNYIREHPEVRDVLVSGGDPLTFSDARLEGLLTELRGIDHVEIVRLATRNPVTLPQRITSDLANLLKKYHPIYISTHFNHLKECTFEAEQALNRLADAGCVLSNQMVLLKGVNEDAQMVKRMNQWLLARRCRPYYIFQCDAALGISHFRTPVRRGLEILEQLRGWTSGLAVPHYVVDLPGGGGKVPLQPDPVVGKKGTQWSFRSYDGRTYSYIEGD